LEDLVASKFANIDNQYRSKVADICRNIDTLKQCNEVAEQYLTKRILPLNKLLQMSLTFKDQVDKAIQLRNERRRQQRPNVIKK